ncbi:SGNH/GDSL hydrolase family protein, partial [Staphylococcus capitis]|nr:SGNH/GDSL hydrolase family protein [Staphylococcus capitis]
MSPPPEEADSPSNTVAQRSRLARGALLSLKVLGALVMAVLMVVGTATALIAYQGKRAPAGNHEYV